MKIVRWFFYGLFLFILIGAMIGFIVTPIVRDFYNNTMSDLDPSAASFPIRRNLIPPNLPPNPSPFRKPLLRQQNPRKMTRLHSAFITTPDGKYTYDWVYNFVDYENNDPDLYTYFYLLIDKDGNEIHFTYYYDGSVGLFTDEHSVFFIRG